MARIVKTFLFSFSIVLMTTVISSMLYANRYKEEVVIYEDIDKATQQPLVELDDPEELPAQDENTVNNDDTNQKASQLENVIAVLEEETEETK